MCFLYTVVVFCTLVGSARGQQPQPQPAQPPTPPASAEPPPPVAKPDDSLPLVPIIIGVVLVGGSIVAVMALKKKKGEKDDEEHGPGAGGKAGAATDIIGNYRLLKLKATGQTSQVYEVVETSSGRHFAMKLLLPEHVSKAESREFLLHEAEVGMMLAHENIIRIVSVSRSPKNPNFVMEFFPAGSLKDRLMRKETDFLREKAHDILRQAATALAFMNAKGWVHRDVKPDNLLVNAVGAVKLIDFAIAQRITKGGLFSLGKGKVQGTRSYMSPEQIRGQALDGRADIYSFGCMCYEVVTGRPPFRGNSSQDLLTKHITEKPVAPAAINADVTKEFSDLVLRLLAKKKDERPKDFHEVLVQLRNIKVYKSAPANKAPGAS